MNQSQLARVKEILKTEGSVSNFKALDGAYGPRINRLAAIIFKLREDIKERNLPLEIRTEEKENSDTIYQLLKT